MHLRGMESECLLKDKCLLLREKEEQQLLSTQISVEREEIKQLFMNMHNEDTNSSSISNSTGSSNENYHDKLGLFNSTTTVISPSESYEMEITDLIFVVLFCLLIIITIIGNTLVIISVITTRRLRTVTNCFVMSLAVADWMVGVFVMPPAVAYYLSSKYFVIFH
jgi:7 transmembrane receptor (rhodopsin family)